MLFNTKEKYLIVGLGNPGATYEKTRHNAGFICADELIDYFGASPIKCRANALLYRALSGGREIYIAKPQTFMNLSGEAVGEAARFYKLGADKIIVISDDISLGVGRLRVRRKGSAGGHNGLKSINEHLGTDAYPRVKVGVGEKPHPDFDLADWVLSSFDKTEMQRLADAYPTVLLGIERIVAGDVDGAMQICNGK